MKRPPRWLSGLGIAVLSLVYGCGGHFSSDEGRKQECLVCQILDVLQTILKEGGLEINLYPQHEPYTVDPGHIELQGDCEIVQYIDNLKCKIRPSEAYPKALHITGSFPRS